MADFQHGLTPEEFTLLLNLLPICCRRGAFQLREYEDVLPLYKKMSEIAKRHPDLFAFDDGDSEDGSYTSQDAQDDLQALQEEAKDIEDSQSEEGASEDEEVYLADIPEAGDSEEEHDDQEEGEVNDEGDGEVEQYRAEIERLRAQLADKED